MPSTFVAIAERALRVWMSKERADSIIGDLAEVAAQKGVGWFWFSLSKIILFLAWRPVLGMASGLYAGSWAFGKFQAIIYGMHAVLYPQLSWACLSVTALRNRFPIAFERIRRESNTEL